MNTKTDYNLNTGVSYPQAFPPATMKKNDRNAGWLIGIFSVVVFVTIVALGRFKLSVNLGFDPHVFARINAVVNSLVALLLVAGLLAVKSGRYLLHKRIMIAALVLSIVFLVSYICHHLLTADTKYGGTGASRYIYFVILITHIFLAAVILPIILFTAYRALTADWGKHIKIARITWPIWFYVSVTGVVVYLMISPYYT